MPKVNMGDWVGWDPPGVTVLSNSGHDSPDGEDRDAEHRGTLGFPLTASEQSLQAGDGRAVDQRRQAGSEDDAAELPPVPIERGAAVAAGKSIRSHQGRRGV